MTKELKYLMYIIFIFIFFFISFKYYFSNNYKKRSYITFKEFNSTIYSKSYKIPILENDTKNLIYYKDNVSDIVNQKQRKFWDLIK